MILRIKATKWAPILDKRSLGLGYGVETVHRIWYEVNDKFTFVLAYNTTRALIPPAHDV